MTTHYLRKIIDFICVHNSGFGQDDANLEIHDLIEGMISKIEELEFELSLLKSTVNNRDDPRDY